MAIYKYPDEVKRFIAENVTGRTTRELVEMTNNKFGTNFTEISMKAYKHNHGLKSGTRCGVPAGTPSKLFPEEVKQYIYSHYHGTAWSDMANQLNQKFGTSYTPRQIGGYLKNHKLNTGRTGRFQKGCTPNAGCIKKGIRKSPDTEFKKGQRPHNYMPVGSERVNTYGYHDIKVADPNKWRAKHILLWEAHNGPVPAGHKLIFGDGDKNNISLDNIILVSNSQMAVLNKFNLIQKDTELTKTALIVADIKRKINERKKK